MRNLVTQEYYTGSNYKTLHELGINEVCTFKQGISYFKMDGRKAKGLKAVAKLWRVVTIKKNGQKVSVPRVFSVFDANDWRQRQKDIFDIGFKREEVTSE